MIQQGQQGKVGIYETETRLALVEVKGSALLLCYAQWPVHGDLQPEPTWLSAGVVLCDEGRLRDVEN